MWLTKIIKKSTQFIRAMQDWQRIILSREPNLKPEIVDVLFFCQDIRFSINLNGKYYSPLLDSIREDIENRGWSTLTIITPYSQENMTNAWSNPLCINKKYLLAKIKDKVCNNLIITYLSGKKYNFTLELFRAILNKTKPKCIIQIGSIAELYLATKEMGIPCVELLHGIGYDPIPWGWGDFAPLYLPDCILSLDTRSSMTFAPLSEKGVKILQIPHPLLKRFLLDKYTNKLPIEWRQQANSSNSKVILISLQWGYDVQYPRILQNEIMYEELIKAIEISHNEDIIWAFRLHPLQLKWKRYKHHIEFIENFCAIHKNAHWKWYSEMPIPVVLKQCSGHITMGSMVSYEAAYMGIKTVALSPTLKQGGINENMFSDLEEAGYLTKMQVETHKIIDWALEVKPTQPYLDGITNEASWEIALKWMLGSCKKEETVN